ncbi:hypothetical protein MK391_08300 [Streptococcus oralis]|jgi:hypothetical protein|uniref:Uncharacterized protein n=1 Tax=Streptococcus oralis TaxID=1303 RepID=A0A081R2A4_STROR|nr:hypothetical protein [Streptococcus oralis]KEQ49327.1 hypothetical protein SK143_2003 [Streptococcus oralis]MCY7068682.1 hypothetical protein [Streptococcus oralis]MCY7100025.1 hypothetical protein [Streptococcus oralis]ORO63002.1 hypothetical protein B7716_01830 [Streptococcus oralis subsp. oralis]
MKKRTLLCLVLSIVVFGGGAWLAQETNLFLSPRAKQLAYLKEHEEEIKEFVKSLDHKVESVQIDWDETMWEKVGNGTPKGGGNVVIVGGGFNNIEGSTWQVIFEIEDGRVAFDTMMQGGPLRVGGRIFD